MLVFVSVSVSAYAVRRRMDARAQGRHSGFRTQNITHSRQVNTRKHDIFERGCICTLALVCRCDPDLREQPLNRSRCRRSAEILILILPRHHCHVREFLSVRLMLLVFCVLCLTLASKLNVSQCLLEFPVFLTILLIHFLG